MALKRADFIVCPVALDRLRVRQNVFLVLSDVQSDVLSLSQMHVTTFSIDQQFHR